MACVRALADVSTVLSLVLADVTCGFLVNVCYWQTAEGDVPGSVEYI